HKARARPRAVLVERCGHLCRGPQDDGVPERGLIGGGHRRRKPRLACPASGALHVLVLPGPVAEGIPDQVPAVRAVPGEDWKVHADRELTCPPGRPERLPRPPPLL